jgi:hypothetical protein
MAHDTVNSDKSHLTDKKIKKPKQTFKHRVSAILSSRRSLPSLQRAPTTKATPKIEVSSKAVLRPTSNILLGSKRWLSSRDVNLSESSSQPRSAKNHDEAKNALTNKQSVGAELTGFDNQASEQSILTSYQEEIPAVQLNQNFHNSKESSTEKQSPKTGTSEFRGTNSPPQVEREKGQQTQTYPQEEIDRAIRESKENFDLILARMPLVSDAGMKRTLENVLVPLAAAIEATIVARNASIRLEGVITDLAILTAQMGVKAGQLAVEFKQPL